MERGIWSDQGLNGVPIEMWNKKDKSDRQHCALTCAFGANARKYNLELVEFPADVAPIISAMVPNLISHNWAGLREDGAQDGGFGAELDREAGEEKKEKSIEATQGLLEEAKAELEGGKANEGQAELVAALQQRLDALTTGAIKTPTQPRPSPGAAARETGPAGKATVLKRLVAQVKRQEMTPRSLADQTALQRLKRQGEAMVHMQHKQYPKTLKRLTGTGSPAPLACMAPAALTDVLCFLEDQERVLAIVAEALASSPNHLAAGQSIIGKAADTTFDKMLRDAPESIQLSPYLVLFGIIPVGDCAMMVAYKHWMPGKTPGSIALLDIVEHLSFINDQGDLKAGEAGARLLAGVAAAGDGDDDHDYNALVRGLAGGLAAASEATFTAKGSDGTVYDWREFSVGVVDLVGGAGSKLLDRELFDSLATKICEFGRLQSLRTQALDSALAGSKRQTGARRDVLLVAGHGGPPGAEELDDTVTVLYSGVAWPQCQCGRIVRGYPLCSNCGAGQGKLWKCALCGLLSRADSASCYFLPTGGCKGKRDKGKDPTPAEVKLAGDAVVAHFALVNQAKGAHGAGGAGVSRAPQNVLQPRAPQNVLPRPARRLALQQQTPAVNAVGLDGQYCLEGEGGGGGVN
jgi:hypothetical protein